MIFSTTFINNKVMCNNTHVICKDILNIEIPGTYKLFNPSICKYKDGYVICARYSNKVIKNIFLYMYSNLDYQSHICFIILSKNMEIQKTIFPKMQSKFLEDPRISFFNNKFYVSITEFISKKHIIPSLHVFDIEFNFINKIEYKWDEYFKQLNIEPSLIQKNLCPFSLNNNLVVHTDTYPTWNVFKVGSDNSFENVISFSTKSFFKDLNHNLIRCSTSWVNFSKDTFICGLHTKTFAIRQTLPTIRTILVEIDKKTLHPIKKTRVLCFDIINNARIQFLSGIESDDFNIYLTFGIGDYKIVVKKLTKKAVKRLLH